MLRNSACWLGAGWVQPNTWPILVSRVLTSTQLGPISTKFERADFHYTFRPLFGPTSK